MTVLVLIVAVKLMLIVAYLVKTTILPGVSTTPSRTFSTPCIHHDSYSSSWCSIISQQLPHLSVLDYIAQRSTTSLLKACVERTQLVLVSRRTTASESASLQTQFRLVLLLTNTFCDVYTELCNVNKSTYSKVKLVLFLKQCTETKGHFTAI